MYHDNSIPDVDIEEHLITIDGVTLPISLNRLNYHRYQRIVERNNKRMLYELCYCFILPVYFLIGLIHIIVPIRYISDTNEYDAILCSWLIIDGILEVMLVLWFVSLNLILYSCPAYMTGNRFAYVATFVIISSFTWLIAEIIIYFSFIALNGIAYYPIELNVLYLLTIITKGGLWISYIIYTCFKVRKRKTAVAINPIVTITPIATLYSHTIEV